MSPRYIYELVFHTAVNYLAPWKKDIPVHICRQKS